MPEVARAFEKRAANLPPRDAGDATLGRVDGAAGCGAIGGWYYDGPNVALYRTSCATMNARADQSARGADVVVGCETVTHANRAPPPPNQSTRSRRPFLLPSTPGIFT